MINNELSPRRRNKGGKFLPALCNVLGIFILVVVIAAGLSMVVPRFLGYEIYNVVSGSMEPEIPVGSILYVEPVDPKDLVAGEVIAFMSEDSVISHRVVENMVIEGEIVTKGDANAAEDMNTVSYAAVIGRVSKHYPMLGAFMELFTSTVGKVYAIVFAACGVMLNVLAGRIRENRRIQE